MNKAKFLRKLRKNPIIFDVGLGDGSDTLEFLDLLEGREGVRIFGFEPEPLNVAICRSRIRDLRFELFEGLVSDVVGPVPFNRSRTDNDSDLRLSGSMMTPAKHLEIWDWIKFDEVIVVNSTTLDFFCDSNSIDEVDLVWADVQGAEEKLITGGAKTLESKVRFLYIEYSNEELYEKQPTLTRILELLPSFRVKKNFGSDVLLVNKNRKA